MISQVTHGSGDHIFSLVLVTGSATTTPIVMKLTGNKKFTNVVHCGATGGLPTWKNCWLFRAPPPPPPPPPKRQPNSFNCWIPLSLCGNLLRSTPIFLTPAYGSFVQHAVLTFVTLFRCTRAFLLVLLMGSATKPHCHDIAGNKRFRKVEHCSDTGAPHLEEFLAVTARFKPPPRQCNDWIPLGLCANLLMSPSYQHNACLHDT